MLAVRPATNPSSTDPGMALTMSALSREAPAASDTILILTQTKMNVKESG